jgi:uncharacterized phage infection (PIP) family protein YhgE
MPGGHCVASLDPACITAQLENGIAASAWEALSPRLAKMEASEKTKTKQLLVAIGAKKTGAASEEELTQFADDIQATPELVLTAKGLYSTVERWAQERIDALRVLGSVGAITGLSAAEVEAIELLNRRLGVTCWDSEDGEATAPSDDCVQQLSRLQDQYTQLQQTVATARSAGQVLEERLQTEQVRAKELEQRVAQAQAESERRGAESVTAEQRSIDCGDQVVRLEGEMAKLRIQLQAAVRRGAPLPWVLFGVMSVVAAALASMLWKRRR